MEHWAGVEILRMSVQKCANNSYLHFCTTIRRSQYNLRRLNPGLILVTRDATAQCCQCIRVMSYAGLVQMCKTPPKRELLCNKLEQLLWGMWKLARPLHWELPSTWLALFISHDCHDIRHIPLFMSHVYCDIHWKLFLCSDLTLKTILVKIFCSWTACSKPSTVAWCPWSSLASREAGQQPLPAVVWLPSVQQCHPYTHK